MTQGEPGFRRELIPLPVMVRYSGGILLIQESYPRFQLYSDPEAECFDQIKKLITFIPWNNLQKAKKFPPREPKPEYNIENIVPGDPKQPYDVRDVIKAVADDSDFFEVQKKWAENIVVGFGRINGETVGFVGNQT